MSDAGEDALICDSLDRSRRLALRGDRRFHRLRPTFFEEGIPESIFRSIIPV
jgi:hypothetical protein